MGHQLGDMMRWRVSHRFGGAPEVAEKIEIMFSCRKFLSPLTQIELLHTDGCAQIIGAVLTDTRVAHCVTDR